MYELICETYNQFWVPFLEKILSKKFKRLTKPPFFVVGSYISQLWPSEISVIIIRTEKKFNLRSMKWDFELGASK
jgi:hypothetical protein